MKKVIQIWNDQELAEKLWGEGFEFLGQTTRNGMDSVFFFADEPKIYEAIIEFNEFPIDE